MLQDTLDRFVADRYGFEVRQKIAGSARGYSPEMWRQFAELGALAALFSEDDGGYGGAGHDIAVVFEALGKGLVVEPLRGVLMAGSAIARAGSAAQRERLADLIEGSTIAAFAHAEAGNGYSLTEVATTAHKSGEGWVLDGAKSVVPQGAAAQLFVVSARTGQGGGGGEGLSLFLVPADATGVTVTSLPAIDGGSVSELRFDGVCLPVEALLGAEGQAASIIECALARGLVALCAEAVGAMDVVRQATLEYLQTRRQFGVPIGSFQALQHRMADVLLEIEQARSALINAAAAVDERDRSTREKALSAAKYTIGRVGTRVAEEGIQLHGGIGMTWELPMSHYAKRLVMIDHELGDEDFHLQRYIDLDREARGR